MVIILGIVFLVMVIMNGALFYVLYSAVTTTKKQVNSSFVKELEDYSGFLEEREKESRSLEKKKEKLQDEIDSLEGVVMSLKTSPFYAPKTLSRELFIPTARYIDNEFFDNHKLVNDMMKEMDRDSIIRRLREKNAYRGNRKDYDTACRLLSFLDMDTAYELCTIEPETQIETLMEYLGDTEKEFLNRYLETRESEQAFDILDFRTFVREIRTLQDPIMYIRTGDRDAGRDNTDPELVYQYDGNISEGIKVIYQNQSYDFSIYRLRSNRK